MATKKAATKKAAPARKSRAKPLGKLKKYAKLKGKINRVRTKGAGAGSGG